MTHAEGPDVLRLGWAAVAVGEYARARALISDRLKSGRCSFDLLHLGASCAIALRDFGAAEVAVSEMLALKPRHPKALLCRAELGLATGRVEETEADTLEALMAARDVDTVQWASRLLDKSTSARIIRARFAHVPKLAPTARASAFCANPDATSADVAGSLSADDRLFLLSLIETVEPRRFVEVSMAGHRETQLVQQFVAALGGSAETIAADTAHALRTADGAARCDFGIIDARNGHPWPALDALGMLPRLGPGSWIAVHDVSLGLLGQSANERGPQHLLGQWPHETRIAQNALANIGAIRLADANGEDAEDLISIIEIQWDHALDEESERELLGHVESFLSEAHIGRLRAAFAENRGRRDPAQPTAAPDGAGATSWRLDLHAAGCEASLEMPRGRPGGMRIEITSVAGNDPSNIQLRRPEIAIAGGELLRLSFSARADEPRTIDYGLNMAHTPWDGLGFYGGCAVGPEWRDFEEEFVLDAGDANAQLVFNVGAASAPVEIDKVVLRRANGDVIVAGRDELSAARARGAPRASSLAELLEQQPWLTDAELPGSPVGMMARREALLCYYLAKDLFRGAGTIVDAGSFLGKSAFYLASGLRANRHYRAGRDRVHCFDNFIVNEFGTMQFIRDTLHQEVAVGESTRAMFDAQVEPVTALIDVHAGDFHTMGWPRQPIEILMVDIAKSESLGRRVADQFFAELIPGLSLVIHQDYHHPWLPHIHVTMEYLAEYFDLVLPRVDDTAVFRLRAVIPAEMLRRAIDYDFSYEEKLRLMDGAIARLPESDRFFVELARIVLQFGETPESVLHAEIDALEERFHSCAGTYPNFWYFDEVRNGVDEVVAWRLNTDGDFAQCLVVADRVLARRPNTFNRTLRGCALLGLGRYDEAEAQFRSALAMNPPMGWAYFSLARTLKAQRRFTEAEVEILRGLRDTTADPVPRAEYLTLLAEVWKSEPTRNHDAVIVELRRDFPDDADVEVFCARSRVAN